MSLLKRHEGEQITKYEQRIRKAIRLRAHELHRECNGDLQRIAARLDAEFLPEHQEWIVDRLLVLANSTAGQAPCHSQRYLDQRDRKRLRRHFPGGCVPLASEWPTGDSEQDQAERDNVRSVFATLDDASASLSLMADLLAVKLDVIARKVGLSSQQRKCVSLRVRWGLTTSEIAQRLRVDRATVREHLRRAAAKLDSSEEIGVWWVIYEVFGTDGLNILLDSVPSLVTTRPISRTCKLADVCMRVSGRG